MHAVRAGLADARLDPGQDRPAGREVGEQAVLAADPRVEQGSVIRRIPPTATPSPCPSYLDQRAAWALLTEAPTTLRRT
ncbi:hypothetical protein [Nocardioides humi]|uniref:hypothetical protein n=1 Tax=Nocardioides humi TaxID=449461 RepID=UPI001FE7DE34|nr:hypothetical protein [Nocardioides humi]